MANVERGVVKAPNNMSPGNHIAHSQGVSSQPPGTHAANDQRSAPIGSSASLGRHASTCTPPNGAARFDVANARMGYDGLPAGYTKLGEGAVPVNPFMGHNNGITPVERLRSGNKLAK